MNSAEILKSTETDTFNKNLISSDTDLLNKVKQVIELTGCSNDIAVTTLFDSNYNIEVAIDKIFDQTQRQLGSGTSKTNNDWKEVAKNKKKQSATETSGVESNTESMIKELTDFKISNDKLRSIHRGTGRGRARFTYNNGRNNYDKPLQINDKDNLVDTSGQAISINKGGISRGRGRKSQYRVNSISHRGRSKHYAVNPDNANIFDGNVDGDTERFLPSESNKWNANYDVCNDWLSDNTAKSNEYFVSDRHSYDNQHCDDNVLLSNPSNSALNMESYGSNFVESCIESVEKSNDIQTLSTSKDVKANQLNPLELVAKCSNKVDIFGGYSRTKPPALSSKVPSEPVKLLTSTGGVVRSNKTGFNFSFGLNFDEYSSHAVDGQNTIGPSKSIVDSSESFISKIISNKQPPLSAAITTISNKSPNEYHQSSFPKSDSRLASSAEKATGVMKPKQQHQPLSVPNEIFSSGPNNQRSSMDVTEKKLLSSDTSTSGYKLSDDNHQPLNTTILSSSSQLCHPPGMSNAHMYQHFPNNQPYFSLLNISNGSSIFNSSCNMNSVNDFGDLAIGSSDDATHQFMHADKEYNQKPVLPNTNSKHNIGVGGVQSIPTNSSSINQQIMLSKISDSDSNPHSSTILPAMPMSNICCFPPMYNFATPYLSAQIPPGHSNQLQTAPDATQSPASNKAIYNLPNSHRNYQMSDEFDDMIQNQNKGKYQRTQNYVSNFGVTGVSNKSSSQDVDSLDVDKTAKLANPNTAQINRQSNQPQNMGSANRTNQQQSMSNDPRFIFHQHQSHPYQNSMFNCVTATGAHPAAPHPYAMAHQGGGLQQLHTQLHLMPQQMHSFPQSYQYQEHILPSMVSNPSSRNNISQGSASSGNQSRNNRSSNQLWNPSN